MVFSNEVCSTFNAMSSRTLLSDHVLPETSCYSVLHCIGLLRDVDIHFIGLSVKIIWRYTVYITQKYRDARSIEHKI